MEVFDEAAHETKQELLEDMLKASTPDEMNDVRAGYAVLEKIKGRMFAKLINEVSAHE